MIIDRFGRTFRNLRLSLTAACNYACTYCVPDGKRLMPADKELPAEDLLHLVRLLVETAGITKLRITGGEPLLSRKFDAVLGPIMAMPGLDDVSLTTNGQLLPRKIQVLRDAGIRRVNVSLDTLDAEKFRPIARSGDLATVLTGIDLLLEAGIKVKLNMVPLRGVNDDQVLPLLEYCLERDMELRYIELMNMGHLRNSATYEQQFFGMSQILDLISSRYAFSTTDAPYDSTAQRYRITDGGAFGIIANESQPFCSSCSRLRLSSDGQLFGCLSNARSHDLSAIARMPEALALASMQRVLNGALADKQTASFSGEVTVMKFIGG
ncbi:MAG: GTP 3',8-cyclase MoaA [Pseudomonadota bacterium]